MTFLRRLQKLPRSHGVRLLLLQAFHRPAVAGQHEDRGLVPNQEERHVYSSIQGQSWPETVAKAEHFPSEEIKQRHILSLPKKTGSRTMSRSLVKKVKALSDVKEDVYGALDEWAAFELEFPVVATRMALETLRKEEQWHRVVQVTKWMFSKGVGKTQGSYALLLKAYCMDERLVEAEELWKGLLVSQNRSMPKNLFAFMTNAYRRRDMPDKVIQVFEQMESFGIKPDKDTLKRVGEAYQQLNMQDKVEQLGKRYAIDSRTRRKEKRLKERKARKALKHEQVGNGEEENNTFEWQTDEDEEDVERQITKAATKEEEESSKTVPEETTSHSKNSHRGRKSECALTAAEDEFLKQVIDTM